MQREIKRAYSDAQAKHRDGRKQRRASLENRPRRGHLRRDRFAGYCGTGRNFNPRAAGRADRGRRRVEHMPFDAADKMSHARRFPGPKYYVAAPPSIGREIVPGAATRLPR